MSLKENTYHMFVNALLGVIGIALGLAMIIKSYYINRHILYLGWAEKKFGRGYGSVAYKAIGFVVIVLSFFVLTGQINLAGSSGITRQQTTTVQPRRSNAPTGIQIAP